MQAGIDALERFTRLVNRIFAIAARVIVLGIVLVVIREVVFRYVLNAPSVWAMDGSSFALVFVFFLALAPALESGHHVAVDLFDPLVPARLRRQQKIAGHLLTGAFGLTLFWYLLDMTVEAFQTDEMTYSVVPVPLKWVYWIGPVGSLEFVLTAVVLLGRAWLEREQPGGAGRVLAGH
jgi:TRAP-type C4-dicarboxylate transport system permease small subunit